MELRIATTRPLPEIDEDEELLLQGLRERGVRARMAAWNDPREDWDLPVPTVLRSTWDYIHHIDDFSAWLARVEAAAPLWNPRSIVQANLHKRYMLTLHSDGVPVVPTELVERGATTPLDSILRRRGWEHVVLKPAIGAASFATRRFAAQELQAGEDFLREQLRQRDMLVQPYVSSVDDYGERALVWIDGEFTHAVRKMPRFTGQDESVSAALPLGVRELALGESALAELRDELLYARVDVARAKDGSFLVMELELIEPSLFLTRSPRALERLCTAIVDRLS
jgi:hypothetical protein